MWTAVGDPVTRTFPLNEGWYMLGQTPRKPQADPRFGDDLRRLTDLTIHEITAHLTANLVNPTTGLTVSQTRPNCEQAWLGRMQSTHRPTDNHPLEPHMGLAGHAPLRPNGGAPRPSPTAPRMERQEPPSERARPLM